MTKRDAAASLLKDEGRMAGLGGDCHGTLLRRAESDIGFGAPRDAAGHPTMRGYRDLTPYWRGESMTRRWLKVVSVATAIVGSLPGIVAHASAPVWASSPAILAKQVFTGSLASDTLIIGYPNNPSSGMMVVNTDSCGNWWRTNGDTFSGAGVMWDGDPAAAYVDTNVNEFWTCAHGTGAGNMYCAKGAMAKNGCGAQPIYEIKDTVPNVVGSNTFLPHQGPALVRYQTNLGAWIVSMFGVGTNNQIWSTYRYDGIGNNWGSWTQLPSIAGGFDRGPGATSFASDGRLMVCSRKASNWKYACSNQVFGQGGSLQWSSWTEIPGFPQVNSRPALTKSNSSLYVFGIGLGWPNPDFVSALPIGGGAWTGNAQVGSKTGFAYGPGAAGIPSGPSATPWVMTVARASDGTYWWDAGSASNGWNTYWLQIQVVN